MRTNNYLLYCENNNGKELHKIYLGSPYANGRLIGEVSKHTPTDQTIKHAKKLNIGFSCVERLTGHIYAYNGLNGIEFYQTSKFN